MNYRVQGAGFLVEPEVRMGVQRGRKMAFKSSICTLCLCSVTSKPNIKIFACGHNFHVSCLHIRHLEHKGEERCPVCYQVDF